MSALSPPRKVCSSSSLKFKFLSWHVCLKFLLDKTVIMKMYMIGFLLIKKIVRRFVNFFHFSQF